MKLDLNAVQKSAGMMFVGKANAAYGFVGQDRLMGLLNSIRSFFQRIPPERIDNVVYFVEPVYAAQSTPLIARLGRTVRLGSFENLPAVLGSNDFSGSLVIERRPNGQLYALASTGSLEILELASEAIIYRYQDSTDYFIIDGSEDVMPKLVPGASSNFATPTLSTLEEALRDYATIAVNCSCYILEMAWEGGRNGPRLVFRNKPESIMRRSLTLFLQSRLRDAAVRPEHNTDETKPVDIKVDWFGSKMRALIEIKWLGKAVSGHDEARSVWTFTEYGPARAQEGAAQLADYLDRVQQSEAVVSLMGYLVVFDGRRRGVKQTLSRISKTNALYFEAQEVSYNPDFSALRDDFSEPIRYFLRPRETYFAT